MILPPFSRRPASASYLETGPRSAATANRQLDLWTSLMSGDTERPLDGSRLQGRIDPGRRLLGLRGLFDFRTLFGAPVECEPGPIRRSPRRDVGPVRRPGKWLSRERDP